jgi:hypothetical protein
MTQANPPHREYAMAEKFVKENDYSLSVIRKEHLSLLHEYPTEIFSEMRREFNFAAAQITTTRTAIIHQQRGYHVAGSSSISTTTNIQNFDDVQSSGEIAIMHAKLIALGGNPPPLEEVLSGGFGKARILGK